MRSAAFWSLVVLASLVVVLSFVRGVLRTPEVGWVAATVDVLVGLAVALVLAGAAALVRPRS